MSAPVIAVSRLEKTYLTRAGSRIRALADVTLDIGDGEFVTIVGPSGCGKTTLLRILGGLLAASSGSVELLGRRISGPSRKVGMVFQDPVLLPWRTVLDNVMLPSLCFDSTGRRIVDARASSWRWSASPDSRTSIRTSCREACGSAWRWPARWSTTPRCC